MKKTISAALAFTMLATSSVTLAGTSEARHRRGDGYYNNGYDNGYYDNRRHRNRGGDAAAAAIIGLALGAIIVGSTTQRRRTTTTYYYDEGYRGNSNWDHVRRCESRYRTYDRRTDTFIGRDGREYYCNL